MKLKRTIYLDIENSLLANLLDVLFSNVDELKITTLSPEESIDSDHDNYLVTDKDETISLFKSQANGFKKVFYIGVKNLKDSELFSDIKLPDYLEFIPAQSATKNLISFFKEEKTKTEMSQYSSIPIGLLLEVPSITTDLFIRLKKDNNNAQYIKRFEKNSDIDKEAIKRYITKGEDKLYFDKKDYQKVEEQLKEIFLSSILDKNSTLALDKSTKAVKYIFEEFGIDTENFEYVNTLSSSIIENIKKDESSTIIKNALLDKSDIYYKKALITSTIATSVINSSNWGTNKHIETIAQMTILCDLFLDDKMSLINSNEKLLHSDLSDDKKQIVLTHAKKAYESLYQNKELDIEFLNLILHHHGKEDGIGFSDTISSDFPDLLMIYRVCEDFAIELIEESLQGNFNVIKIYEKIKAQHKELSHQEIIKHAFFSIYAIMKDKN